MNKKLRRSLHTIECKECGKFIHFIEMKGDGRLMACETTLQKIITRNGNLVEGFRSHYANCLKKTRFRKWG